MRQIALQEERIADAHRTVQAALRIARPREHYLTVFRAEWLWYKIERQTEPGSEDARRLSFLKDLFEQLDEHEGIEEIQEFRDSILRRPHS